MRKFQSIKQCATGGLILLGALAFNTANAANWVNLVTEPGRRVEIDSASVSRSGSKVTVSSRVMLDTPLDDLRSNSKYQIIEASTRYDCDAKSGILIKRAFRKSNDELVREEEGKSKLETGVRSGTVDERLMQEVCKAAPEAKEPADKKSPKESAKAKTDDGHAAETVKAVASGMQAANAKSRTTSKKAKNSAHKDSHAEHAHWSYRGATGPDEWANLDPANRLCRSGQRQSPINIEGGVRLDLEPIMFNYLPAGFQVVDNGHTIQAVVPGNSFTLAGKTYRLLQLHFHRPSEERINGRASAMVAHLVHQSPEGDLAVVAVLLDEGQDNAVIQQFWNNLPLEKNRPEAPSDATVDLNKLLPKDQRYYTYMGSLTTPPCTEGILWLVMKESVSISADQIDIFARLYANNSRPIQSPAGRFIKESR